MEIIAQNLVVVCMAVHGIVRRPQNGIDDCKELHNLHQQHEQRTNKICSGIILNKILEFFNGQKSKRGQRSRFKETLKKCVWPKVRINESAQKGALILNEMNKFIY